MFASRRPAIWPQVVAISLIGLGAAGCSDSGRFDFSSDNARPRREVTGSIPARPAPSHVVSQPLPPLARADTQGISGGGRGMGSYQPSDVTGSVRAAPPLPPPRWTWNGGIAVTVEPGETLEMIARKHDVPLSAIMEANHITNPAAVHPGQHLVIPRRMAAPVAYAPPATTYAPRAKAYEPPARPYVPPPAAAYVPPATRIATVPDTMRSAPPRAELAPREVRDEGTHVVKPGETLNSIARLYGKSVMVLAKANNFSPYTMVWVGQRIKIPGVTEKPRVEAKAAPLAPPPVRREVATEESPHSAWKATPVEPPHESPVKAAEATASMPSFRWPVRGRIIAGFGPSPNGLQNDGIDVSVPQGTPIKAADDGVVAYAGNELKGYGNLVLIRHSDGYVTAYAHASEILVKRGQSVKRGEVIAKAGDTGNVKTPELHFEIRKGATPVDPAQFLNGA
jgi:murein DD-endopeptidase MepM/ murein hydrolase activator NlpD